MISHDMVVNGLTEYAKNEVMPNINDVTTKVAIGVLLSQLRRNPEMIDKILGNPVIGDDVETFLDSMKEAIMTYGNFTLVIPKIPLLMPTEQKMTFCSDDIDRLKYYMR